MKIFQHFEALDQWEPSLDIPGPMRVDQAGYSHLLEAGKSCYCLPGSAMFGFQEELNIYKITDNCLHNLTFMQNTNPLSNKTKVFSFIF